MFALINRQCLRYVGNFPFEKRCRIPPHVIIDAAEVALTAASNASPSDPCCSSLLQHPLDLL